MMRKHKSREVLMARRQTTENWLLTISLIIMLIISMNLFMNIFCTSRELSLNSWWSINPYEGGRLEGRQNELGALILINIG